jgi:CBS domain containing-hemolysin-like protein
MQRFQLLHELQFFLTIPMHNHYFLSIRNNEFIFSGRLKLDYLSEKYNLEFPDSESETLSGYIISQHETIPKLKERIIVDNYEFDVLLVSDTRIETVKLKILGQ